ncbi:MAG: 5-formyltetrahydrofolate cyclo-ligase [Proteobacteria bacterium]|nr:5-formyltetrahydrofolate cyclo-ligase [Pseudomonadota bacterium]
MITKQECRLMMKKQRDAYVQFFNALELLKYSDVFDLINPDRDVIGGYYPIGSELNILPLLSYFLEKGYQCALPSLGYKDLFLTFKPIKDFQNLALGKYGIPIPSSTLPSIEPTVFFVPLLAFNAACYRLGYGGGYYDNTLRYYRSLKNRPLAIGVGYDHQYVEHLPFDERDEPLDYVITPTNIFKRF